MIRNFAIALATLAGMISSRPALAAEAMAMPRYRFAPGDELQYHSNYKNNFSVNGSSADLNGSTGSIRELTDWTVWATRANADGSVRLVFRSSYAYSNKIGKRPERKFEPQLQFSYCDLLPDGRILPNESMEFHPWPDDLLPRLPCDAATASKGWNWSQEIGIEGHAQFSASIQPKSGAEKIFAFQVVKQADYNEVYLMTNRWDYEFDRVRGLMQRARQTYTQGYGFEGTGTGITELVAVNHRDPKWTDQFTDQADRYFKAIAAYRELTNSLRYLNDNRDDGTHAKAMLASAEKILKDARAELKQPEFVEQIDYDLSHHHVTEWIVKGVERFAARRDKPAPDWKLEDLAGKSHSLKDYRGKVVLLDFWYRGCPWCIRAMPQVEQLSEEFKGRPVAVLGMNTNDDPKDAEFVAAAMHLTYPVLKANHDLADKYGTLGWPNLVLIDQKGIVRLFHVGCMKPARAELSKAINDLLAIGN